LTAESIIALFHNIAKAGTAVIISTHNTILAEEYPARTLRFYKKHIEEVDLSAEE
jgi:ABC-type ATPase involved in cell division